MSIQIGKYTIEEYTPFDDGIERVWICLPDGEHESFEIDELEAVIDNFYKDNF